MLAKPADNRERVRITQGHSKTILSRASARLALRFSPELNEALVGRVDGRLSFCRFGGNAMIQAIPTRFVDELYRSKLEATWAVFYSEIGKSVRSATRDQQWSLGYYYEFDLKLLNEYSWYKADFVVRLVTADGRESIFAHDVKPSQISDTYQKHLSAISEASSKPLFLTTSGFTEYKNGFAVGPNVPKWWIPPDFDRPISMVHLFKIMLFGVLPEDEILKCCKRASEYRFDLEENR